MQIQKDYIRENILAAALDEFSSKGYRTATMSSIAECCGISKSNLYRYFSSKDEICHELLIMPSAEIRKVLNVLTGTELLVYSNDEIAKRMTELLYPVISKYKKEIKIIMSPEAPQEGIALKDSVEKKLLDDFLNLDPERTPDGFASTLVKMLMSGIESILSADNSDENTKEQIESLLRYHTRGVLAFSLLRKEQGT